MMNDGVRATLGPLWGPIMAITTRLGERANGQIAIAGLAASLVHDAPRVLIELWKTNYTHDLIHASGVFALHLLPSTPATAQQQALTLIHDLGMRSGRDGDKLGAFDQQTGVTGVPILRDALAFVEARVVGTLDAGEATIFLGDVVAGERLRAGEPLRLAAARQAMPAEWLTEWEANDHRQRDAARRLRGL